MHTGEKHKHMRKDKDPRKTPPPVA